MNIGERVKKLRLGHGLNQKQFCASIGLTQGRLSEIESHKNNPSFETLVAIHNTYKISLDWLISGTNHDINESIKNCENDDEKNLLNLYRELQEKDKEDVIEFITFKINKMGNIAESSSSKIG